MTEFFLTKMGQIFFEGTMPSIARSLKSLSADLELRLAGEILANLLPAKMRVSMPGKEITEQELKGLARLSLRAAKALRSVSEEPEPAKRACEKCGCNLTGEGFCTDETCPHHTREQED